MFDKEKMREKREKDIEDSVNLWQSFISTDNKETEKKEDKQTKDKK